MSSKEKPEGELVSIRRKDDKYQYDAVKRIMEFLSEGKFAFNDVHGSHPDVDSLYVSGMINFLVAWASYADDPKYIIDKLKEQLDLTLNQGEY